MTEYYRKSLLSVPATYLTLGARRRMYEVFVQVIRPTASTSVLDLGVTSEPDPTANYFDYQYPYTSKLTGAGLKPAAALVNALPSMRYVQLDGSGVLPFGDRSFDVVHCNAVIEHVGSSENQKAFIREILRVSKRYFITTPNRWFPVEMHTHLPLVHYLPSRHFRRILELVGENFYSREDNLNLLSARKFCSLFPKNCRPEYQYVWSCGFPSNIIVHGDSTADG